ncbi:MAG: MFS transporter [Promethearchaeota archaeon]
MSDPEIRVYSYRWIVLLMFILVNITIQILWISFASVTSIAMDYYDVDALSIYLLSMSFMIVYIPITFLASWMIDKFDFKIGAGIGAMLAGVFGFLRMFAGTNFTLVLIFQMGIAIGQPFILNSITKLSANWFPESERTSATGLSLIAGFIGIALGLFITPFIVESMGFFAMLLIYGIISLATGLLFIFLAKDRPPTPPSKVIVEEKVFMFEGMKQLFTNKYFIILLIMYFIGLGIFNTITTYIESIVLPRDFDSTFAGIMGGLMLLGGIVGCIIMSYLSDTFQIRKPLIITSITLATISLLVISFSSDGTLLLLFAFLFGYGIISVAPVALEYAVDITSPVPEASSNGALMMIGQVGGILLILGLEGLKTPSGDYFPALILQTILLAIVLVLTFFLKEPEKK